MMTAPTLSQTFPQIGFKPPAATQERECTIFDMLYDRYLPFRLYAEFMLGSSTADLARRFALPEIWIEERIAAISLCIGKQVRLNLLERQAPVAR